MTNIAPVRYAFLSLALLLAAGVSASCSESNFAGGGKGGGGFGLGSGGGKGNDGDETDCDPQTDPNCELGNPDESLPGGTGTGTGGGPDSDGDGVPDALEPGDSNGDEIPDAQQPLVNGSGDANGDGIPDVPGLEEGDGTQSNKLTSNGKYSYGAHDEDHQLIVQRMKNAMPDGAPFTLDVNDDTSSGEIPDLCFNHKKTCVKITLKGKVTQTLGLDSCIISRDVTNGVQVDADTDGSALIGSCVGEGDDEQVTVACENTFGLEAMNCTGT